MAAPKPCDRFWNGTRTVCGPRLLIPGLGKCGTNAIANYLALHPRVRLTNQSEVMFDPRDVPVSELVTRHNPDVTPEDAYVWIMKHPGLENRHASVLARRVRRAFPSASVALALCDPAQRAFRFFIYFLEHELRQHGQRVTFTKFAQVTLKRRYNTTVEELYSSIVATRTDCVRPESASRLVSALRNDGYTIPPNWLLEDSWDPLGHGVCDPIVAKDSRLDRWVEDWIDAGYAVNSTLAVAYMESWASEGTEMVRRLLRVLGLAETEYPWAQASVLFTQRVYDSEARRRYFKKGAPDMDTARPLMHRQCGAMEGLLGERPPWCRPALGGGTAARRRGERAGRLRRGAAAAVGDES
jgi:hypothetical protein